MRLTTFLAISVLVMGTSFVLRLSWEALRPAEAQETGTCPAPQLIDTFEGNGDQQSDTFDTTTNSFRVSYEVTGSDPQLPATLFIDVIDANDPNQFAVANATQDGDGSGETFVNSPAGSYFLDITFFGGEYTITVEQCEGGDPSRNPGGSASATAPASTPAASTPAASTPAASTPAASASPSASASASPEATDLMESGGPVSGPLPLMPNGECPAEYPAKRNGACYE